MRTGILKKIQCVLGAVFFVLVLFLSVKITYAAENSNQQSSKVRVSNDSLVEKEKELSVNIRKRVEWVNETNGDAEITLQYEAGYGSLAITPDMNVILIHDKSGSMDSNYGHNLEVFINKLGEPERIMNYPSLTGNPLNKDDKKVEYISELSAMGSIPLMVYLNGPNEYTKDYKGYFAGYYDEEAGTNVYWENKMRNNSACQVENHYYLLRNDDDSVGISAWSMSCGRNLHNIRQTDLHHYQKISKTEVQEYVKQGRRVMCFDSGVYYDALGKEHRVSKDNPSFFLDITQLCKYKDQWILNTCGEDICQVTDRLSMSQQFFNTIVKEILDSNPSNKISYIPFWGDVPTAGSWRNEKSNDAGTALVAVEGITRLEGVTKLDFTSDRNILMEQINHPFTYNGTNWTKAFQNAITILNNRSDEDKKIDTLVLFLTDGMPAGTSGTVMDAKNKYINGIEAAERLKEIEGVYMIACGVGINQLDETGLANRLMEIDTSGSPHFARFSEDFDDMINSVVQRIKDTYMDIYGEETFYQDQLNSCFSLDESRIDNSWQIIENPSQSLVKGVPENVYDTVLNNENIKHVYVKNTKKIYWYIGKMTNGTYEREGHSTTVPIKFSEYFVHTNGNDKNYVANKEQCITYYTNQNSNDLCKVSIDAPILVFNRKKSEIIVHKKISTTTSYDRECRFVYSKTKYTGGQVKDVVGSFLLNIPAGAKAGTYTLSGLEDGVYYIYEVDEQNKMINQQIGVGKVDYNPKISTKEKSSLIPWSITKSDNEKVTNLNNYLELSSTDSITFDIGAELTIIKEIDCAENDIRWEHGNPTFTVQLQGIGTDGKQYTFYHTFEFTKTFVQANSQNGKVAMSYTFSDIPVGEEYYVRELQGSRYNLSQITLFQTVQDAANTYEELSDAKFYSKYAKVNLKKQERGLSVKLYNKKENYRWFNHITCVKNVIDK